jgi:single-strand selective monofunctional uracil DNA glycosylase
MRGAESSSYLEPMELLDAADRLRDACDAMRFGEPVTHVYNPLRYAWDGYRRYCELAGAHWSADAASGGVVLLGMNPGPWGMAQTGVPFGEIGTVREWFGFDDLEVGKPAVEHPKRPILGLGCPRSEVSGKRLWGLMAERFGSAEDFFRGHFVCNYCPLVFMEGQTGRNRVPEKLPRAERAPLAAACDEHLVAVLRALRPRWLIGIGAFAEKQATRVVASAGLEMEVGRVLHPSPASPQGNKGWGPQAARQMESLGVW